MGRHWESKDEVVDEIVRVRKSLPERPSVAMVEAAEMDLARDVEEVERSHLADIESQSRADEVPEELFSVLQRMQRSLASFQAMKQRGKARKLLDLEETYQAFDGMAQDALGCLSSSSDAAAAPASISDRFSKDDSCLDAGKAASSGYAGRGKAAPCNLPLTIREVASSGQGGKLDMRKLRSEIEESRRKETKELKLGNKLRDDVKKPPDTIGWLSFLVTLDLSENRIVELPDDIGRLSSLTRLDLHSNQIIELPGSIGDLPSLEYLYLNGNELASLPPALGTLGRLAELDVSSNHLSILPGTLGDLISLRVLSVEGNDIEELPCTIGNCSSLVDLRANLNQLKGLPEALGSLASLEVLTIRYNNVKNLPTTLGNLSHLREIDVSNNQLESVPEGLCSATTLVRLNIANNFASLRSLPLGIGNLKMLEVLNMSNNQITQLPDSFATLTRLHTLETDQNPLDNLPRDVAAMGAQAVVSYMSRYVASKGTDQQQAAKPWTKLFVCGCSEGQHE